MSQETYSIPSTPSAQFDYQRNLVTRCTAGATTWGIPAAKLTALAAPRATYEQAFVAASNAGSQNPSLTAAREAAWAAYVPLLDDLLKHQVINNAAISAADKVALYIHTNGGKSTAPAPAPATTPVVSLVPEEASMLHVVYADSSSPTVHSKPANVAFCELAYKVGDPAPASVVDCPLRHNTSRSHEAMPFAPEQRGKAIHAYARWVNKNGKLGPWGGVVTAFVP